MKYSADGAAGRRTRPAVLPLVIICLLAMAAAPGLFAQTVFIEETVGFSNHPWNIASYSGQFPEMPYGIHLGWIRPKWVGLYVSGRMRPIRPAVSANLADFNRRDAEQTYGSEFQETEHSWGTINLGSTRKISNRLGIFAGIGLSIRAKYHRYLDTGEAFPWHHVYWIQDKSDYLVNWEAGIYFFALPAHGVILQLGYADIPQGVIAGVGYAW